METTEQTRICPTCGILLSYKNKYDCKKAIKKNKSCGKCAQQARVARPEDIESRKRVMFGRMKGKDNPFYGRKHTNELKKKMREKTVNEWKSGMFDNSPHDFYKIWVSKYGEEEANIRYKKWISKLSKASSGIKNSMFGKPSPQGSGNGWSGWYKGWFFRSLKELSFAVRLEEEKRSWVSAESKEHAIPYKDWKGVQRTYFADFLVEGKILVEVKPSRLHNTPSVNLKREAAETYCKERGWVYNLNDCEPLSPDEIRRMRNVGDIRFIEKYETKFKEEYGDGKEIY